MSASADTYWTLDVELAPASEELWSLYCYERGAGGCQWVEEHPERLLLRYTFEVLESKTQVGWLAGFRAQYPAVPPPARLAWQEHPVQPWATQWREHFRPMPVGERLLVCPPWDKAEANAQYAGRLRVVIDPGQGFGTGQHASTALCLGLIEAISGTHPPARVLDVGTGSGILAIAACLLGARDAVCIDTDDRVVEEVRSNFALSGIPAVPTVTVCGPEAVTGQFPLVLANLTAPVLTQVAEDLVRLTSPGGHLILSGILTTEYPEVEARFAALRTSTVDARHRDSWTGLLLNRPNR